MVNSQELVKEMTKLNMERKPSVACNLSLLSMTLIKVYERDENDKTLKRKSVI